MAWPRPGDTPESMYGFKDEAQLAKMKAIAPVVGVMQAGSALDVIRTNEKLAEAAGSGLTVLPGYGEDYYWEVLSWDIVLYSVRDSFTPEPLMEQPVFARLEARRPASCTRGSSSRWTTRPRAPRGWPAGGERPEGDYLTLPAPGASNHWLEPKPQFFPGTADG